MRIGGKPRTDGTFASLHLSKDCGAFCLSPDFPQFFVLNFTMHAGATCVWSRVHSKIKYHTQHRSPPLQKTQGWGTLGGNGAHKDR